MPTTAYIHSRWWVDEETNQLVEPLMAALKAPLDELLSHHGDRLEIVFRRGISAVLQQALYYLRDHPATDAQLDQLVELMGQKRIVSLKQRTWDAEPSELILQQELADLYGLRVADVQALAVRVLAGHYGLPGGFE